MSITDAGIEAPATSPATSTADTRATEPEVIAGISSGEGSPDMPLEFRTEDSGFGIGRIALLLIGGAALGYGIFRWMRSGS